MRTARIPGLDKDLSRIVLGCDSDPFRKGEDLDEFIDGALKAGLNVFDTAHKYGDSELVIGHYLKNHPEMRDKMVIISKGCHPVLGVSRLTPAVLQPELDASFGRLGTDYIDIYFLHRDDHKADLKGLLTILDKYHKAGKIGIYGGSNWRSDRIEEANRIAKENGFAPFMASSPNYSLAIWEKDPWGGGEGCVSVNEKGNTKEYDYYKKTQMPIFTYSSLARGFLTGRVTYENFKEEKKNLKLDCRIPYESKENLERLKRAEELAKKHGCTVSQISLAYLLAQPLKVFPIVATTNLDRLKSNLASCDITLSQEEVDYLSYQE